MARVLCIWVFLVLALTMLLLPGTTLARPLSLAARVERSEEGGVKQLLDVQNQNEVMRQSRDLYEFHLDYENANLNPNPAVGGPYYFTLPSPAPPVRVFVRP